ncbi:MAG: hypothetical protein AUG51_22650 [Acidobacteria bacterium 13_1_20CM_3_53_8]|nr:MAG: hypothetical protein AUG51_22650 [Acidobacteria bacterium 13_1_20CM_3_53_8]
MSSTDLNHVTRLAEQLSPEEQLRLVEHLARGLRRHSDDPHQRTPQSLRGIWRDALPPDADTEVAIREVRNEWEKELKDLEREQS